MMPDGIFMIVLYLVDDGAQLINQIWKQQI